MPKGAVFVNTSSFDLAFNNLCRNTIPELSGKALYQQGFLLLRYAILEEPRAPHKTGTLWNSQRVEEPQTSLTNTTVTVGFNCEYAAAVHEAPSGRHWTLPGSGPKFLESKLIKHREELMKRTADYIKARQKP